MKNSLIYDGLEYWRGRTPDKIAVALDDDSTSLTYQALGRWSDGVANHLQAMGVKPGENVAITGANSLEWIVAAFGVLKAGATIVPFNERFVRDEFAYLVEFSAPSMIIADAPRAQILSELNSGVPIVSMEQLEAFKTGAPGGWRPARVSADALAMIIFTSGTTGRPKGVMIAHGEHYGKFLDTMLMEPEVGANTRIYMPLSIQAAPGTQWGYVFSTIIGGSCYFTRKFEPARALRTLVDHKITLLLGMPIVYEQIVRCPAFETADLSSLTFAQIGGARISQEILGAWRRKGVVVRPLYGMTEVGGCGIVATAEDALARPDSCGRGMPLMKIRIVRPDGSDAAPNEPGLVLMRGPGMMVGYWRNPEATAQAVIDGWMHSGDIGVIDEEGYFTFVDRSKDMIISGGFNISPSEVERVISTVEGVVEVAVVSVPDERFGETPFAYIHATEAVDSKHVFEVCRQHLAGFKLPRYIAISNEPLPRMTSGKINKRQIAEEHADAPSRYPRLG